MSPLPGTPGTFNPNDPNPTPPTNQPVSVITRVFGNPKSTVTAVGIASVVAMSYAGAYPKLQILAASAAALAAVYKLLSTDT